jgi:hypothetical protein
MDAIQQAISRAQAVKQTYEAALLKKKNVVGVGVGFKNFSGKTSDQVAIVVNVTHKVPLSALRAEDIIPTSLEDVPVDIVATGVFRADEQSTKEQQWL